MHYTFRLLPIIFTLCTMIYGSDQKQKQIFIANSHAIPGLQNNSIKVHRNSIKQDVENHLKQWKVIDETHTFELLSKGKLLTNLNEEELQELDGVAVVNLYKKWTFTPGGTLYHSNTSVTTQFSHTVTVGKIYEKIHAEIAKQGAPSPSYTLDIDHKGTILDVDSKMAWMGLLDDYGVILNKSKLQYSSDQKNNCMTLALEHIPNLVLKTGKDSISLRNFSILVTREPNTNMRITFTNPKRLSSVEAPCNNEYAAIETFNQYMQTSEQYKSEDFNNEKTKKLYQLTTQLLTLWCKQNAITSSLHTTEGMAEVAISKPQQQWWKKPQTFLWAGLGLAAVGGLGLYLYFHKNSSFQLQAKK